MRSLFSKPLRPSARHLFEIFRSLSGAIYSKFYRGALVPQSKVPSPKRKSALPQRFVILPCPWRANGSLESFVSSPRLRGEELN